MENLRLKKIVEKVKKLCAKKVNATPTEARVIPVGFFPIYVGEGEEREQYVVPITLLSSRLFQALLNQFQEQVRVHTGDEPLSLPCSTKMFESILNFNDQPESTTTATCPIITNSIGRVHLV